MGWSEACLRERCIPCAVTANEKRGTGMHGGNATDPGLKWKNCLSKPAGPCTRLFLLRQMHAGLNPCGV